MCFRIISIFINTFSFALAPHYINTIDQLNDRIASLSCSMDKFYGNDEIYNIVDESDDSYEKIEQYDSKSSSNTGNLFSWLLLTF